MMTKRCEHWNARGYGRCILKQDHPPVHNGCGVYYAHSYETHRWNPAMGTLDVYEAIPR